MASKGISANATFQQFRNQILAFPATILQNVGSKPACVCGTHLGRTTMNLPLSHKLWIEYVPRRWNEIADAIK